MTWAFVMGSRRIDVGNDTYNYVNFFENRNTSNTYDYYEGGTLDEPGPTIEKGFILIGRIIHLFTGNHATFVFLIIQFWFWSLIYILYKRNSVHKFALWNLMFLFSISNLFVTVMVAVRQTVSICVFLTAFLVLQSAHIEKIKFSILKNKKVLLSFLLFLLAFESHRTSLLIMPFVLALFFVKFTKKWTIILLTFGFAVSLFMQDSIVQFVNFFLGAMVNTASENLQLLGDRYANDYGARNTRLITNVIWYVPFLITTIGTEKKEINNFFFKCMILASSLNLFFPGSEMIERTSALAMILGFTKFVPNKVLYNSNWRLLYLLITLAFLGKIYIRFTNWPTDVDSCIPYHFFWQ